MFGVRRERTEQMQTLDSPIFVDRQSAAASIRVSLSTIDKLIRNGQVEIVKLGRRVLVRRESLERLGEK